MLYLISWFCAECAFGCLFNLTHPAILAYRVCIHSLSRSHFSFTTQIWCLSPVLFTSCLLHQTSVLCPFVLENREEVQTESPDLLNCWQLCSLQGVSENSHLQGNPACLLQIITIQSYTCLHVLNTKKQKPLLIDSTSHTALFILLMRVVGAILRGTLGQCFTTALAQTTKLGRACKQCEGELKHHQNVATASSRCVLAWSYMYYGLWTTWWFMSPSALWITS